MKCRAAPFRSAESGPGKYIGATADKPEFEDRSCRTPWSPGLQMDRIEPFLQDLLGVEGVQGHHQPRDQSGPARLMAGADPRAVVPMEVLVEEDQVAPVRVRLEFLAGAVHWPAALPITKENAAQPASNLVSNFPQGHLVARPNRAFHGEVVAKIGMHLPEGLHEQSIDGHPERTAPVGIAAEQARG